MKGKILSSALAILALSSGVNAYVFAFRPHTASTVSSLAKNTIQHYAVVAHTSAASKPVPVVLNFDNYGFDPNILHIPKGTTVIVKNISTKGSLLFESLTPQVPSHAFLDLGTIRQGQQKSFKVATSGVWQYEGNNIPSLRGVISTVNKPSFRPSMEPNASIKKPIVHLVYDDYGFMPNEITVSPGTVVQLKNITDNTQPGVSAFEEQPGQVPYPALNVGSLPKQSTAAMKLNRKGSWILENIDQPTLKALARITIK